MRRPDLLAHSAPYPGAAPQTYEEHVGNVRRGARERAEAMLCFATPKLSQLLHAIEAAAVFHDLGKLDSETQAALKRGRNARLPWDHIDAGVAHLSAAKNWMAAWLVRAHHAPGLPAKKDHFDRDKLGRKLRGRRRDDEDADEHDKQVRRTDSCLSDYLCAHEAAVGAFQVHPARPIGGLAMRLALSCLVDADHADSARSDTGFEPPKAPEPRWAERAKALDTYIARLGSSGSDERDRHRAAFYRSCCEAIVAKPMVACEGPVGIGKTTAITAYLIRRAEVEKLRRLIIVAPYTNVIEQTVARLRKALVLEGEDAEEVVVAHHHKADFATLEARDLTVLWRAPVIVTTAVQFFETLASKEPATLRKLHALPGSAVFIDEAHAALPAHLWQQNWRWLTEMAESWGCWFVFASGSLARFWENPDIIKEPVQLPELLPPGLKAPVLAAERRRIRYESAGRFETPSVLIQRVREAPGPRLVILNTVQSAAVVARAMREAGEETLHLSTALAPKDRSPIFAQVEERLSCTGTDWTLVATSCVEAGVDLSFRTAFRESFSTASLIQVGGRVNRHGAQHGGIVYDFQIDRDGGITEHPAARHPAAVLRQQFQAGLLTGAAHDPAAVVTQAMADEIRERGGLGTDLLSEAESMRNYPCAEKHGRVIDTDTRLVVVDPGLVEALERREPVGFRELLAGSVQLWIQKINSLRLANVPSRPELYLWPYEYDAAFLGCMAGLLKQVDLDRTGIVIH